MVATSCARVRYALESGIAHGREHPGVQRVLLMEPDADLAAQTREALSRCNASMAPDFSGHLREDVSVRTCSGASVQAIASLTALHQTDLETVDILICEMNLPDGFGLDALAYCRGVCPNLPVILIGESADLALAAECIRAGAWDFVVRSDSYLPTLALALEKCLAHQRIKQENERLQADLSQSLSELADKNRQLHQAVKQLRTMARTDELTGLYNRRWLNETLERHWTESLRHGCPLACLMIDLDRFKQLNDCLGHQRGDVVLKLAARVIAANCRNVDVAARYGGDEFCVLMPHTRLHDAILVANRILREFEYTTIGPQPPEDEVGMSIGVSHVQLSRPANAEVLVGHADEALYAAKSAGRNTVMARDINGVLPIEELNEDHSATA